MKFPPPQERQATRTRATQASATQSRATRAAQAGPPAWAALAWGLPLVVMLGTLLMLWPLVSEWQRDHMDEPRELAVGQTRTIRMQRLGCPRKTDLQTLARVSDDLRAWYQTARNLRCQYLPKGQKVTVQAVDADWVQVNWPGQGDYWTNIMLVTAPCDWCE